MRLIVTELYNDIEGSSYGLIWGIVHEISSKDSGTHK
jgi:hypothetical protein